MRAIVKPWNRDEFIGNLSFYVFGTPFVARYDECTGYMTCYSGDSIEIINEDEWDAEIYALLLIESGVIYE